MTSNVQSTFIFSRALLPALCLSLAACTPVREQDPTQIENPAKLLGAAKKDADRARDQNKTKINKKKEKQAKKDAEARKAKRAKPEKAGIKAPVRQAKVGGPTPDFVLNDLEGKPVKLSDHKGKTIVLEWFNPECPFVKYAHGEGPLKSLAETYTAKGVVWLAVNSGAPGNQGHDPAVNIKWAAEYGMKHPVLLDESGGVGHMYGAKTTPQIFVIDPSFTLRYAGALDNAPRGKAPEGGVSNYAAQAIDAVLAGAAPDPSEPKSYGCSVKYAG